MKFWYRNNWIYLCGCKKGRRKRKNNIKLKKMAGQVIPKTILGLDLKEIVKFF